MTKPTKFLRPFGKQRVRMKPARRQFLRRSACTIGAFASGLAAPGSGWAQAASAAAGNGAAGAVGESIGVPAEGRETRLALLLGNQTYPAPFELPAIPKNVRDLTGALQQRGFEVTDALDLDLVASRQALEGFIRRAEQAPPNAAFFFYFSGHGVQVDAANLLLPAGVNPAAHGDILVKGCVQLLADVVGRLPERPEGTTIAVVDACRTTLKPLFDEGGLNQVEAPPGCLIAFSTGAGKPAIGPSVSTQNTFYTASLVRLMSSVSEETSFTELFQLVKTDVHTVMLNHPVEAIRKLAQDPFIADHTRVRLALTPVALRAGGRTKFSNTDEEGDWARLERLTWPTDIAQAADVFLRNYPKSKFATGAQVARDGAREAAKALRRSDVHLYRAAFALGDELTADQKRDLTRAGRGDKDAAARAGRQYRTGTVSKSGNNAVNSAAENLARYEGWMQYAAALGNGIASYELALYYRRQDQPLLASQFESRARELGYTPPPTLDNVRK